MRERLARKAANFGWSPSSIGTQLDTPSSSTFGKVPIIVSAIMARGNLDRLPCCLDFLRRIYRAWLEQRKVGAAGLPLEQVRSGAVGRSTLTMGSSFQSAMKREAQGGEQGRKHNIAFC